MYAERVRESDGDGNAGVGPRGCVVAVRAVCECMGGTRGSGFVYTADDVLETSVVPGVVAAGGVCGMCMCLARGGVRGVGVS